MRGVRAGAIPLAVKFRFRAEPPAQVKTRVQVFLVICVVTVSNSSQICW